MVIASLMSSTPRASACLLLITAIAGAAPAPAQDGSRSDVQPAESQIADSPPTMSAIEARVVDRTPPNRLTPEIAAWAHEQVTSTNSTRERLQQLLRSLLTVDGLEIKYMPDYTGTAVEVFESREANCLSFTHLLVATAREIGIDAYYLSIDEIERYTKRGDFVVISNHITAGFGPPHERIVLDFTVRPDVDYRRAAPVTDETAFALHYSNRGAEMMQEGELTAAIDQLYAAIARDPELAAAWSNLGVARRRQGDLEGAEASYHRAIGIDDEYLPVYQNLLALYQIQKRDDAAEEVISLLNRRGNRNPFSFLALGDASYANERYDQARLFYKRARRLARGSAEPLAALGLVALAEGDRAEAERWHEKAVSKNAAERRTVELANALADGDEDQVANAG